MKIFESVQRADVAVVGWMDRFHHPRWIAFFNFVSLTGIARTWFFVAGVLGLCSFLGWSLFPEMNLVLSSMRASLIAWGMSSGLKRVFRRERPFEGEGQPSAKVRVPFSRDSFPSSHVASSMALFFALAEAGSGLMLPVGVWAVLVLFSRIFLNIHFLSDVFGGVLVGYVAAQMLPLIFWPS